MSTGHSPLNLKSCFLRFAFDGSGILEAVVKPERYLDAGLRLWQAGTCSSQLRTNEMLFEHLKLKGECPVDIRFTSGSQVFFNPSSFHLRSKKLAGRRTAQALTFASLCQDKEE